MRKRIVRIIAIAALLAAPALAGNGTGGNDGNTSGGGVPCGTLLEIVAGLPLEGVTAAEEGDLLFMREEEKVARDAYLALDDIWGMRVFGNITWAEQTHMDAILALLDKYGIEDPVGANPPGVFSDADLQQLFGELLAQGELSLIDALLVGAQIEDVDIFDLGTALDRADNTDIRVVYQNLRKASRNHLRSFVGLLAANGVTYEPQFLSAAEFAAIVESPAEQGLVDADGEPVDCGTGGGNRDQAGGRAQAGGDDGRIRYQDRSKYGRGDANRALQQR